MSGFFGIFGLLHLVRLVVPFRLVVGVYDVPLTVTAAAGICSLMISAGFLMMEARRERTKRLSKG